MTQHPRLNVSIPSDPNARLTQRGRYRLVNQHPENGRSLPDLATESGYCSVEACGYSLRCGYLWLAQYLQRGQPALGDRWSVRRHQRRTLDPQKLQRSLDLHDQRLIHRHITRILGAPFSTVPRTLSRLGLRRLRNLESKPPVQRYVWKLPGDLIRIDLKSLARFRQVGYGITGVLQQRYSFVHG